jgi:hypothetical protein
VRRFDIQKAQNLVPIPISGVLGAARSVREAALGRIWFKLNVVNRYLDWTFFYC